MALSAKGEARGVSTTNIHLSEGINIEGQDIYAAMSEFDESVVYCFGQAVGKDRGFH